MEIIVNPWAARRYLDDARSFFMGMVTDSWPDPWQGRRGALLGVFVALAVLSSSAACAQTSEPPPPQPATSSTTTPPAPLVPLAPELVGTWVTKSQLDSSGSQNIVRTYRFAPDGRYDYTIALCRSSTDCSIQSTEAGIAQADQGVLALKPQTRSSDGPRAFRYAVGRDPDVGDLQLHFFLTDGQIDIFYGG